MNSSLRRGKIDSYILSFLGSVGLLGGLVGLLIWDPQKWFSRKPSKEPLVVHCAAGLRGPVEAAAAAYEKEYGIPVQLTFGGSQTLLASIELTRRGDLYIPGDESFLQQARDKKLIDETIPLVHMAPVLAVPRGNPKNLRTLDDLLKPDVRLSQANPDAAAVGTLTRSTLGEARWNPLKAATKVFKLTENEVATDIQAGAADAGIIWDSTVRQTPTLEAIPLQELAGVKAHASAAIIRSTTQPTAALKFARFLGARDRGLPEFDTRGFKVVEGDVWAEEPELKLLSGSMLRPAIEDTIVAFEAREGVKVTRVYNGCGILVAQMKAGQRPDAYFACDKSFMDEVAPMFTDHQDMSVNQLVIVVPRGNPHGLKTLADLGKEGLRVGIGHEKQCALGALTQQTLGNAEKEQSGVTALVMKNVKVQTPTGDMLVNQLRAGSLDAVVAYVSNVVPAAGELEAIALTCAPVQPLAAGKMSDHKHTTARLIAALRSSDSKDRFEASGFRWLTPSPKR